MSAVLKAGEVARLSRRPRSIDLIDHLSEANAVVAEAKRNAARIVAEAEQHVERMVPQVRAETYKLAYEKGDEEGCREGREAGTTEGHKEALETALAKFDEQHVTIVKDMERVISEVDANNERLQIAARRDVLDFSVRLATKLTFEIGSLHREAAIANLNRALDLVHAKTGLTVYVHPSDLEAMTRFSGSVLKHVDGAAGIEFVADDSVSPGGCVVKSERTEVDATLDTQIDEIVSLLLGKKAQASQQESGADEGSCDG